MRQGVILAELLAAVARQATRRRDIRVSAVADLFNVAQALVGAERLFGKPALEQALAKRALLLVGGAETRDAECCRVGEGAAEILRAITPTNA